MEIYIFSACNLLYQTWNSPHLISQGILLLFLGISIPRTILCHCVVNRRRATTWVLAPLSTLITIWEEAQNNNNKNSNRRSHSCSLDLCPRNRLRPRFEIPDKSRTKHQQMQCFRFQTQFIRFVFFKEHLSFVNRCELCRNYANTLHHLKYREKRRNNMGGVVSSGRQEGGGKVILPIWQGNENLILLQCTDKRTTLSSPESD